MVRIRTMTQEDIQKCDSFFYDIFRKNELKFELESGRWI
jgi:hypothetical protein